MKRIFRSAVGIFTAFESRFLRSDKRIRSILWRLRLSSSENAASKHQMFIIRRRVTFSGSEVRNFINSWAPDDKIDMMETACSGKRRKIISHPMYRAKMGRTRSGKVWNNELFFQIIKFSSAKKTWTSMELLKFSLLFAAADKDWRENFRVKNFQTSSSPFNDFSCMMKSFRVFHVVLFYDW